MQIPAFKTKRTGNNQDTYVPNALQIQLPYQPLQHHQSQQPSFPHQPGNQNFSICNILKPPKLNLTATAENYDLDINSSNYEHETNEAAKEQKNSWQLVKKRKGEKQTEEPSTPTIAPTEIQNRYNPLTTTTETDTIEKIELIIHQRHQNNLRYSCTE
jgi:hypothetical protein